LRDSASSQSIKGCEDDTELRQSRARTHPSYFLFDVMTYFDDLDV
jgi:hypothetical protein